MRGLGEPMKSLSGGERSGKSNSSRGGGGKASRGGDENMGATPGGFRNVVGCPDEVQGIKDESITVSTSEQER